MASKLSIVESLRQCPICLEDFKDPRVLSCLHTLCRDCLEKHVSASKQRDKFSCPSCRHECHIPDVGLSAIPKNLLLNSLKELFIGELKRSKEDAACGQFSGDGGHRKCDGAKFDTKRHRKVTSFCAICAEFYCKTCSSSHGKFAATRTHQLTPAAEVDANTVKAAIRDANIPHCEHHRELKLNRYCDTCRVPVCTDCCILPHKHHEHRKLVQVAHDYQNKLAELSKSAATRIVTLDKHLEEIETSLSNIQENSETACQEVHQAANELRDLVTKRERCLIQQIQDKQKEALLEANAAAKETELTKNDIKSLQSYIRFLQESGSLTDQVVHTPGLEEQLRQQQAAPLKTVGLTACFKKETNSVAVVDAMLGTVNKTVGVPMGVDSPFFILKHTIGETVSGLVVLGDCVCATGWAESKLWIHNTATNTSKVHTLEGLRAVGLTVVGKDTDNTVVIGGEDKDKGNRLHFVTLDRNTLDITTYTVNFTFEPYHISIHPVTGQLVIADVTNKAIVTCDTQGNIQNCIKVQTDVGDMWCAVATDDGYVILDKSDPGRVHWVDSQGKVTHTYGQGHGQGLRRPWHLVRGSQGQLVIADTFQHRLHLVDASGQLLCFPLTQNSGIKDPSCVLLEEATSLLYVAHGSDGNYEIRVYKWPTATHTQHQLRLQLPRYE